MQEEVNQKTVALSIRTTKLTGKVLAAALGKVVRALQKHHRKALTPQGRQSVKKLMNHYGGKSAMPYVGAPKDFDRIAKEFHVDYAFHKVSPGHYLLFFKANQADAITAALQKYSARATNPICGTGFTTAAKIPAPAMRYPARRWMTRLLRRSWKKPQSTSAGPMCGAAPARPLPLTVRALSAGCTRPAASTTCPVPQRRAFTTSVLTFLPPRQSPATLSFSREPMTVECLCPMWGFM